MAMTVRFSTDVDARLQQIADARHTSKHAVILQATEEFIMREDKTRRVLESLEETQQNFAEVLRRLEDS